MQTRSDDTMGDCRCLLMRRDTELNVPPPTGNLTYRHSSSVKWASCKTRTDQGTAQRNQSRNPSTKLAPTRSPTVELTRQQPNSCHNIRTNGKVVAWVGPQLDCSRSHLGEVVGGALAQEGQRGAAVLDAALDLFDVLNVVEFGRLVAAGPVVADEDPTGRLDPAEDHVRFRLEHSMEKLLSNREPELRSEVSSDSF